MIVLLFCLKQKTAYEVRISDWSADVCSSDLLVETITVPGAPFALDDARVQAAEQALRLLHLIAGVSYYKAAVPEEIRIDSYAIDAETAALLEEVYLTLGRASYRARVWQYG